VCRLISLAILRYSPTLSHENSVQNCSHAELVLHQAIQSNPRFSSAAYNLALFYQRMHFLHDAEHWYLHAIAYNPHHALSFNNLGVLYMNTGRKALALHYFKKGLAVDPDCQLILSNVPIVQDARVLSPSEIERVYEEPNVCNIARVCVSVQRASSWGKPLALPPASAPRVPQQPHPLTAAGNGPVNFASSFSDSVNLISAPHDSDIPDHATPVQLRPEDYVQLLERALKEQPNNMHFRKLAMDTCDSLGRTECVQRHRSFLNSATSRNPTPGVAAGKKNLKSK
jgi:tetratricopeptide (TPR) repeat protein